MPDAITISVLRDIVLLAFVALGLAVVGYHFTRRALPLKRWNYSGNVMSRGYELPDGIMALLLCWLLVQGLFASPSAGDASGTMIHAASNEGEQLGGLLTQIAVSLFISVVLLSYLRFIRGFDPAELFGVRNLSRRKVISYSLGAIAPTLVVVAMVNAGATGLLEKVWPNTSPQEIVQAFETTGSLPVRILMAFTAVIVAPLSEELLFRGFFYGVCKRYTDSPFAALITGLLFATVHLHIGSFVPLFTLSVILVIMYELTGSLVVPIFMHAMFNATMMVAMLIGAE